MSTIKDVAKMAGVSVSTVSRVINDSGYVGAETRTKVHQAMKQLQFSPNGIARGLVSGKTSSIGLVIPDVSNPFFSDVARGTEDAALEHGFSLILCNSDWRMDREKMYLGTLRDKWVDGVIVAGTRSPEKVLLDGVGELPLVLVDRKSQEQFHSVWINNELGAQVATGHLLDIGCTCLAHITGPEHSPSAIARQRGFEKAVSDAKRRGLDVEYRIVSGDFRYEGGYKAGKELFATICPIGVSSSFGESDNFTPDGVFAANDLMAIGVIQATQSLGLHVPQDVAVIGYDNIAMSEYVVPKLTTIDQPGYQMGRAAFQMLYRQLTEPSDGIKDIEFEPKLILRESTAR